MHEKKQFIRQMYATLAAAYDRGNHLISLGWDRRWRKRAIVGLPRMGWIIDLGGGTGDLTQVYHESGPATSMVALVDFSREMVNCARKKFAGKTWRDNVFIVLADIEHLPFRSGAFAGAMSAFVLRNLPSIAPVAQETVRVLDPRGRAAFLDATRPPKGWWRYLYDAYFQWLMPRIAGLVQRDQRTAYQYLANSVVTFPPAKEIARTFREAGFAQCSVISLWGGVITIFRPQMAERQ